MVNLNIHVKSNIIEHVEDIHLMLEHMIVKTLKDRDYTEAGLPQPITKFSADVLGD